MKNGGLLLILGIAAIAYYTVRGAQNFADRLKVNFRKVSIDTNKSKQTAYTRLFYTLTLDFVNPESFQVQINTMALDLFIGDRLIGTISKESPFIIQARDTQTIPFELAIPTIQLGLSVSDLVRMAKAGSFDLPDIHIVGFLQTAVGRIPVDVTKSL